MGKIIAVLLTIIIVAAVSMVSMVGAVNAAAPGDPLYSVDRQIEAVRLGFADSPRGLLNLQVELTAERMAEFQEVAARGDLIHFDEALVALEESVVAIETLGVQEQLPPQTVTVLIDQALAEGAALDDNENDNENENENANVNDNANTNDNTNTNDNSNTNTNTNDNSNTNTNDNTNENANTNENPAYKHSRSVGRCGDGGDDSQPAAQKLATSYGVSAGEVMDWFCGGYGFGEIALAYKLSQLNEGMPVQDIFQLRADGMGWGQIMQQYGLIGKNKAPKTNGNGKNGGTTPPNPVVTQPVISVPMSTPQAPVLQGPKKPKPGGPPITNFGNPNGNGGGNGNGGNNGNSGGNGGGNGGGNNKGGGKKP